jgi:2-keto-3-deoxy-L-rhamnonate aldolase RhmA
MNRRFGCWLDLPSPHVAEIVAQTGFDWVLIDLEHGPIGVETASLMLMALKSTPARGIVRIPELTEGWMKRALDMGAHGVMVPNIAGAAQAEQAAQWFHYGPRGRRGEAQSIIRAADWGRSAAGYSGGVELIIQIEHKIALSQASEIAAIDGVHMLFLGPSDFAAACGLAKDAPEVLDAARHVAQAANAQGKRSGSVLFPGGAVETLHSAGVTDISITSDVATLVQSLDATLATVKG